VIRLIDNLKSLYVTYTSPSSHPQLIWTSGSIGAGITLPGNRRSPRNVPADKCKVG
jgi:hypothetical protein